jgi:hypothetical protein
MDTFVFYLLSFLTKNQIAHLVKLILFICHFLKIRKKR